jgi:hypothetical protein
VCACSVSVILLESSGFLAPDLSLSLSLVAVYGDSDVVAITGQKWQKDEKEVQYLVQWDKTKYPDDGDRFTWEWRGALLRRERWAEMVLKVDERVQELLHQGQCQ